MADRAAVEQDRLYEQATSVSDQHDGERAIDRRLDLERILALIRTLKPIDRRVILLYLEDIDATSIAEITGLSRGNVAVKIHRIKEILSRRFCQGKRP